MTSCRSASPRTSRWIFPRAPSFPSSERESDRMPLKWRWAIIAAVTLIALILCYPIQEKIKLGLDLKGGVHLVMRVKTDDAIKASTDLDLEVLRSELTKRGVNPETMEDEGPGRIHVKGIDSAKATAFQDLVSTQFSAYGASSRGGGEYALAMKPARVREIRESSLRQALETIRSRIDKFGVTEQVIQQVG